MVSKASATNYVAGDKDIVGVKGFQIMITSLEASRSSHAAEIIELELGNNEKGNFIQFCLVIMSSSTPAVPITNKRQ